MQQKTRLEGRNRPAHQKNLSAAECIWGGEEYFAKTEFTGPQIHVPTLKTSDKDTHSAKIFNSAGVGTIMGTSQTFGDNPVIPHHKTFQTKNMAAGPPTHAVGGVNTIGQVATEKHRNAFTRMHDTATARAKQTDPNTHSYGGAS